MADPLSILSNFKHSCHVLRLLCFSLASYKCHRHPRHFTGECPNSGKEDGSFLFKIRTHCTPASSRHADLGLPGVVILKKELFSPLSKRIDTALFAGYEAATDGRKFERHWFKKKKQAGCKGYFMTPPRI